MASNATRPVMTGEVTDLREFIARSFSNNAEDPVIFKQGDLWRYRKRLPDNTFWSSRLQEEKERLLWLNSATEDSLADAANKEYIQASQNAADRKEHDQEKIKIRERYVSMMAKLAEWQAKLPHEGLLAFSRGLMNQLRESLEFDCGNRVADPEMPVLQTPSQYKENELKICTDMIKHYEECIANRNKEVDMDNKLHNSLCQYLNDDPTGEFGSLVGVVNVPSCA